MLTTITVFDTQDYFYFLREHAPEGYAMLGIIF